MKELKHYIINVLARRYYNDEYYVEHYIVEDGKEPPITKTDKWWFDNVKNLDIEERRWGWNESNVEYKGRVLLTIKSDKRYKDGYYANVIEYSEDEAE